MKRFTTLIGTVVMAVAACGGAASPTPIPAAATPAATPAPVTASPAPVTASPAAFIEAKVTFDGTKCTYAGPATVPHGSTLVFTLENTAGGMADGNGAALVVAPVVDGTTWEQVLATAAAMKASDIPAWAVIEGAGSDGLAEAEVLFPESAALGTILTTETERNTYYVGCATAPEKSDKIYPALLLTVLPG
jgi:hypothetical protein